MAHLALAEKASAILVAPATAESLSHLARGGAGDLISAVVLAVPRRAGGELKIPVFIAPAMHTAMWLHPATQANVKLLKGYGYRFIGPDKGALGRSGDHGEGRMTEPALIVQEVLRARS
jgi:phosphopantothenoylcysteine decarboxylase/phosphopantothenate--cysteine ligase